PEAQQFGLLQFQGAYFNPCSASGSVRLGPPDFPVNKIVIAFRMEYSVPVGDTDNLSGLEQLMGRINKFYFYSGGLLGHLFQAMKNFPWNKGPGWYFPIGMAFSNKPGQAPVHHLFQLPLLRYGRLTGFMKPEGRHQVPFPGKREVRSQQTQPVLMCSQYQILNGRAQGDIGSAVPVIHVRVTGRPVQKQKQASLPVNPSPGLAVSSRRGRRRRPDQLPHQIRTGLPCRDRVVWLIEKPVYQGMCLLQINLVGSHWLGDVFLREGAQPARLADD